MSGKFANHAIVEGAVERQSSGCLVGFGEAVEDDVQFELAVAVQAGAEDALGLQADLLRVGCETTFDLRCGRLRINPHGGGGGKEGVMSVPPRAKYLDATPTR